VQSVRNQVINIRQLLRDNMTIDELKREMISSILGGGDIPAYKLTAADWEQIQDISAERYRQWEWNFGRSPNFRVEKSGHLSAGQIDVSLEVAKGRIQSISFVSDEAKLPDTTRLEQALIGTRYDQAALAKRLDHIDLRPFRERIDNKQLIKLIY
jgi:lipoate-protein ligase A